MYVSHPNFFEGERDESDDRLKWYGNYAAKDLILSAQVSTVSRCHSGRGGRVKSVSTCINAQKTLRVYSSSVTSPVAPGVV